MIDSLIVYNRFWIEGKIPSFNELVFARAVESPQKVSWLLNKKPSKKKSSYVFNQYNSIKQDWDKRIAGAVKQQGFIKVESAYFHYLVIEKTKKRDPSNVFSAAIKFCEDGLMKAGVIDNDGWDNVLGIRPYILLNRTGTPGIFVLLTNQPLSHNAVESYYNDWKLNNEKQV